MPFLNSASTIAAYAPCPRALSPGSKPVENLNPQQLVTPWEEKKAELGEIKGDEALIRQNWEQLEKMAYTWIWQWIL